MTYKDDIGNEVEEAAHDDQQPAIRPDRVAEAGMIQHHIEQALDRLSPKERTVFVMRHYNDLPLKEIAETLDIAEGTVKSFLFRAVQRLQKELAFYRNDLGLENKQ